MQNAIKLKNISNLITSPSSYQCRKTRLVHFVIHGRHTSMECITWTKSLTNLHTNSITNEVKKSRVKFYVIRHQMKLKKTMYMQFYVAIADIGPYSLWLLPVTVK
jgi:hypothetical protein